MKMIIVSNGNYYDRDDASSRDLRISLPVGSIRVRTVRVQRACKGLPKEQRRLNCARFHLATFRRGRLSIPRNTGFPLLEAERTPPLHFPRVSVRRINESALVPRGKNVIQCFEEIETRHLLFILFHIYYPFIIGNELNNNTVNFFHAQQLSSRGEKKKANRFIMRVSHGNKYLFPLFRRREEPIDAMKNR